MKKRAKVKVRADVSKPSLLGDLGQFISKLKERKAADGWGTCEAIPVKH